MGAIRRLGFKPGDWICDSVSDLTSVVKEHGVEAYIIDEQVWAKYNAYVDQWRIVTLGQVPVAGLDPADV